MYSVIIEIYAGNYNIEDSLVNGVDGISKRYTKSRKNFDVIWIDFVNPNIGRLQRNKYHEI